MSNRKSKKVLPVLVKVGKNLINPADVSAIRRVNIKVKETEVLDDGFGNCEAYTRPTGAVRAMYVIDMVSNPNPRFTIWAKESEIQTLVKQFRVIE